MTRQEAINILDGFRRAFRELDRVKAFSAVNALVNTGTVVTRDSLLASKFSSALSDLARTFDAMDKRGVIFPSS
jgi:hypothetical protein